MALMPQPWAVLVAWMRAVPENVDAGLTLWTLAARYLEVEDGRAQPPLIASAAGGLHPAN